MASSSSRSPGREQGKPSEPDEEQAVGERKWVVLASIPVVIGSDDERAARFHPDTDILLDLHEPPRPSYLLVPEAMAPAPRWPGSHPYIVASDSSARLVVHATQGEGVFDDGLFLCDGHARTAMQLPAPPPHLGLQLHQRRRNVGLISNPLRFGHYLVPQLRPAPTTRHDSILVYCTATKAWAEKKFVSSPEHKLWGAHGVLAYHGLLWWVDAAYGMLVCDPLLNQPELRLVPLPVGCDIKEPIMRRNLIDESRLVRCSEDKLRYVHISGLSYDDQAPASLPEKATVSMWTLRDPEGPLWHREFEIAFADILGDESYLASDLPPDKLPKLALVDPNNHNILYFFQGKSLFGWDVAERRVVACEDCLSHVQLENNLQESRFQTSRFVDAWKLPSGLGDNPSCDGASEKVPTHLLEGTKGNVIRVNRANPFIDPQPSSVLAEDIVPSRVSARDGLKIGMNKLELQLNEEQDEKARNKLLRQQAHMEALQKLIDSDDVYD